MSRISAIALTGLAPLSWGTTYIITTELLPPDRPLFAGLMRALPAGLLLLALTRKLPQGSWWWRSAVLGVLNIGAFFPLLFLAAYRLPGGLAAVMGAAGPLFAAGFTALLLSDRPAVRTWVAGVAGVLGVGLVVLKAGASFDLVGVLAGVLGAASMAAGTVLGKKWKRPEGVGPLVLTGWQLSWGGLLIVPLALFIEGAPPAIDGQAVIGYTYLALIGTAIAYALWFRGIGLLPATSVAFLGLLSPLAAAVIGWAVLGQSLGALQLLGMAVAFGSTIAGQLLPGRKRGAASGSAVAEPASGPSAEPGSGPAVEPARSVERAEVLARSTVGAPAEGSSANR